MNCKQIDELLADYLGNELHADQRLAVESHLADCPTCRAEVASLSDTLAVLARLEAPVATAPAAQRSLRRFQPLAYAATLLIGLGLGWWIKLTERSRDIGQVSESPVMLASTQAGLHPAWIEAAFDPGPAGTNEKPFARNALRFARAFTGWR